MSIEFYVLDSETNGLKAGYHEISELCCIRVSDRLQIARNVKVLYPERSSPQALAVTGKTRESIIHGIDKKEVIDSFEEFFALDKKSPSHRCIVAHNAPFDQKFLHAMWGEHKRKFPVDMWLDTVQMTKSWALQAGLGKPSVKLIAAAELLGAKTVEGIHNAVSDTRNLYFVWQKLLEKEVDYLKFIKLQPHTIEESGAEESID